MLSNEKLDLTAGKFQNRNRIDKSMNFPTCSVKQTYINGTQRERLVFHSIQYRKSSLAASDLFDLFTQSIKFYKFYFISTDV